MDSLDSLLFSAIFITYFCCVVFLQIAIIQYMPHYTSV